GRSNLGGGALSGTFGSGPGGSRSFQNFLRVASFGGSLFGEFLLVVLADDAGNVSARFAIRRDAIVLAHSMGASVVGGQGFLRVSVILIEKLAQVGGASVNVLGRIEAVLHAETGGSVGHELHQAPGSLPGNSIRVKSTLVMNDGAQEIGVDAGGIAGVKDVLGYGLGGDRSGRVGRVVVLVIDDLSTGDFNKAVAEIESSLVANDFAAVM